MQPRGENLLALLARAERERRMPALITVSSDEALLSLEAQDAIRATARTLGYSEREVLNTDARFDWSRLAQASQGLSLFAERRIVEVRLPTGKPGVTGATALEALAQDPSQTRCCSSRCRASIARHATRVGPVRSHAVASGSTSTPSNGRNCHSGSASGSRTRSKRPPQRHSSSSPSASRATCLRHTRRSQS